MSKLSESLLLGSIPQEIKPAPLLRPLLPRDLDELARSKDPCTAVSVRLDAATYGLLEQLLERLNHPSRSALLRYLVREGAWKVFEQLERWTAERRRQIRQQIGTDVERPQTFLDGVSWLMQQIGTDVEHPPQDG